MQGRNVVASALAVVALGSALCSAAPKVDIRIVPRPRAEVEEPPILVPVPIREPFEAPNGPFWNDLDSLGCVREEREMKKGKAYQLDLCHLDNVTIVAKIEEPEEKVEVEVVQEAPEASHISEDGETKLVEPVAEVKEEGKEKETPEIPTILGIFRGWHIDPITLYYKYMIYDDGDECGDNGDRYSITVELVPSSNKESDTRLYGLKKTGECTFKGALLTYVAEEERAAQQGIHTPGVLDISDPSASLPVICGKMKCRYEDMSTRVRDLQNQIRRVQQMMAKGSFKANTMFTNMTLDASKSMLESSTQILDSSLELLHEIEDLQHSLTNDFLGREEAARKQIEKLDAAANTTDPGSNTSKAPSSKSAEPIEEQGEVAAES